MDFVLIGEIIVSPTKTLFMDEISTGLDSSTTYQIVKCLQQIVHLTDATVVMSLLQPAPETFDLFDDIILLSDGQIVYEGPREHVLEFFGSCGFQCPDRKGTADFLQEVNQNSLCLLPGPLGAQAHHVVCFSFLNDNETGNVEEGPKAILGE